MERGKMDFMYNEAILFLNFNSNDIKRLKRIHPIIKPLFPKIISVVMERIGANPKLVNVMKTHQLSAETAQSVFQEWLDQVFTDDYDNGFVQRIYQIASTHERIGINPKYVTMTMGVFILAIDFILSKMIAEREMIFGISHSIKKVMFLSLTLMSQSYEEVKREKVLNSLEHV
jgi:hypothetical protein